MKKKILKSVIIIITITLATGCEFGYLDLDKFPLDQISSEDYWKTAKDLELYVNRFYVSGSDRWNHIYAEDIDSDDMVYVEISRLLEGSRTIPASGGLDYSSIRDINYFFANYKKCQDSFDEYKASLGAAHFFRAFFYFQLVKEYGDVPWISKPLNTDSEELYMARTPRNQVVDSIVGDLNKAIDYLPSDIQEVRTKLNKGIAQLFKSRVCLYEGTWEKYHSDDVFASEDPSPEKFLQMAVDAAGSLIESGLYDIYTEPNDPKWNYFKLFGRVDYSDNPEVLLWKKYDLNLGMGHGREHQTGKGWSGGVGLTKPFVESYLCTDGNPIFLSNGSSNPLYKGDSDLITLTTNRDPRIIQTIVTPGFPLQIYDNGDTTYFDRPAVDLSAHMVNPTGYQMVKFLNWDPIHYFVGQGGDGFTAWIIFRYAEALLNYAEAKAELGELKQEDIDKTIKLLRNRVGMPNLDISNIQVDPNWNFPELSPVINEIRRERRIEVVGEALRWDDIARWAAADELIVGKRLLGAKFNDKDYSDLNPENFKLTNGYFDPLKYQNPEGYGFNLNRDYLSPISTEELTLNPNLGQNPGW